MIYDLIAHNIQQHPISLYRRVNKSHVALFLWQWANQITNFSMIPNKWGILWSILISCVSWNAFSQSATDSTYTVQVPKGYQIPLERLNEEALEKVAKEENPETDIVFAATHKPALYQLNFDTTMSIEVAEIMEDVGHVDFATDALILDRLSCLQNRVPLNYHPRVKAFINYFGVKDREFTLRVMQRKELYFPIFERVLAEYGMPDELKYLSIIESALIPKARSRARAVGLWQFMSATGRMFKLKQDYYIDERMDPEKSTVAACRYLKSLHEMFGDWELAIAAYNCGPGNIRKAIRRSGYKKSFWEIYPRLPRETRSYLPQLVAMIYVMNHTEELSLVQDQPFYPIPASTVYVSQFIDLGLLAKEIKVCEADLRLLNPELKQAAVPAYAKSYPLKIPAKRYSYFIQHKEQILTAAGASHTYDPYAVSQNGVYKKPNKYYHVVRSGESLGLIAQKNSVGLSALKDWNNLSSNKIYAGQRLIIYSKARSAKKNSSTSKTTAKTTTPSTITYHRVRYGEVLGSIARRYRISVSQLQAWNSLTGNNIYAGQKLRVKAPGTTTTSSKNTVEGTARYHIVKSGETLGSIASSYRVTVSAIKTWNKLSSSRIRVGQKLLVKTKEKPVSVKRPSNNGQITGGKYHTVNRGETLLAIAKRYGINVSDLKRWNNLTSSRIDIGQRLVVVGKSTSSAIAKQQAANGYYIVKSGDSLWTIAQAHNITVSQLKTFNGLRSSRLSIGQKLRIR